MLKRLNGKTKPWQAALSGFDHVQTEATDGSGQDAPDATGMHDETFHDCEEQQDEFHDMEDVFEFGADEAQATPQAVAPEVRMTEEMRGQTAKRRRLAVDSKLARLRTLQVDSLNAEELSWMNAEVQARQNAENRTMSLNMKQQAARRRRAAVDTKLARLQATSFETLNTRDIYWMNDVLNARHSGASSSSDHAVSTTTLVVRDGAETAAMPEQEFESLEDMLEQVMELGDERIDEQMPTGGRESRNDLRPT